MTEKLRNWHCEPKVGSVRDAVREFPLFIRDSISLSSETEMKLPALVVNIPASHMIKLLKQTYALRHLFDVSTRKELDLPLVQCFVSIDHNAIMIPTIFLLASGLKLESSYR